MASAPVINPIHLEFSSKYPTCFLGTEPNICIKSEECSETRMYLPITGKISNAVTLVQRKQLNMCLPFKHMRTPADFSHINEVNRGFIQELKGINSFHTRTLTLNKGQSGLRLTVQMWFVPPHSQCRSTVYLSLNETTHVFHIVCLLAESEWGGYQEKCHTHLIPTVPFPPASLKKAC